MPDILTLERVAECRERAERATEGPWEAKCSGHDYPYIVAHGKQLACGEDFGKMPDAEFIAHARTDIPALCAAVEALRSLVPKPEIHPCAGRAMAMREEEPFEWEWNGNVYTYNGQDVAVQSQLGDYEAITSPNVTATFSAGRHYQRERGDK